MHFKREANARVTVNSLQLIVKEDDYMKCDKFGRNEKLEDIIKKAKQKKEQEERVKAYLESKEKERIESFIQKGREEKKEVLEKIVEEFPKKTAQELEDERKAKLAEERKAKKEAEQASAIEKFEKDVYDKIYDRFRGSKFDVMAKSEIPKIVIQKFLCKNWDIVGEYLDIEGNFKYTFTKILNAECGEFTMRPYVNLYELEEEALEEQV